MKLNKILCLEFNGNELDDSLWVQLDQLTDKRLVVTQQDAVTNHSDADALLVKLGAKVPKDFIDTFPNLKYIGMLGTGYGGIDVTHASTKGITVTNIAGYATEAVAEFTFGLLLNHLRELPRAYTQAQEGNYSDEGFNGTEIKGKKFGVIGLGAIGLRIAELAHVFGASVSYWSRNPKEVQTFASIDVEKLLADSDIITLNLASNPETEHFLNPERLAMVKSGAIIVNTSPMELFDFEVLVDRLKKGNMTLILDHSDEMTEEQLGILKELDNCIMYPPIGYMTAEASSFKKQVYVDNVKNFLAGMPTNKVS